MTSKQKAILVNARYWMGELHGWLWAGKETTRDGPQRKQLVEDIKRLDWEIAKQHRKGVRDEKADVS